MVVMLVGSEDGMLWLLCEACYDDQEMAVLCCYTTVLSPSSWAAQLRM